MENKVCKKYFIFLYLEQVEKWNLFQLSLERLGKWFIFWKIKQTGKWKFSIFNPWKLFFLSTYTKKTNPLIVHPTSSQESVMWEWLRSKLVIQGRFYYMFSFYIVRRAAIFKLTAKQSENNFFTFVIPFMIHCLRYFQHKIDLKLIIIKN